MFRAVDGPALDREFFEAQLADEEAAWLVTERSSEIVGFVNARVKQAADRPMLVPRRYVHVESLVVRASSRRAGVGRALLAAAEEWAAERGLAEIELNVWEFNQQAIGFYEQLGYVTERRTLRRIISNVNS
jgi:ribosomal protein S18 acetylase RimI-like enzyme